MPLTSPIAARNAVLLYSVQTTKGVAVTPATPVGIATFTQTKSSNTQEYFGVGTAEAIKRKGGMLQVGFDITISALQSFDFLANGIRTANGPLPYLTMGFGYVAADGVTKLADIVVDCVIHSWSVSVEAGGTVTATASGVGGLITSSSALSPANLTPDPLMYYEGVLKRGGASYGMVRSVSISYENNVEVMATIAGAPRTTFKRGWEFQTPGNISVSGEIVRYTESGVNFQADCLTDALLELDFTDLCDETHVVLMDIIDSQFTEERVDASDSYTFSTPFIARNITVSQVAPP